MPFYSLNLEHFVDSAWFKPVAVLESSNFPGVPMQRSMDDLGETDATLLLWEKTVPCLVERLPDQPTRITFLVDARVAKTQKADPIAIGKEFIKMLGQPPAKVETIWLAGPKDLAYAPPSFEHA